MIEIPAVIENAGGNCRIVYCFDAILHDLNMSEMALQEYLASVETCRAKILACIENFLPVTMRFAF